MIGGVGGFGRGLGQSPGLGRGGAKQRPEAVARPRPEGPSCPWSPCPTHPHKQPSPGLTGPRPHSELLGFHPRRFRLSLLFPRAQILP